MASFSSRAGNSVVAAVAASAALVAIPLAYALKKILVGSPAQDFVVSCSCGRVRATITAPSPLHLVCHCDDCQDYIAWVGEHRPLEYGPLRTVGIAGGVRTVQVFKRDVVLDAGCAAGDLLQLTRLEPSLVPAGRPFTLERAHATCCGTPLFNTWPELASISFFAAAAEDNGGTGALALRQPPEWRLNTKWAPAQKQGQEGRGQQPPLVPVGSAEFPALFLLRFVFRNWWWASRASPAPFAIPAPGECTVRSRARRS